MKDEKEDLVTQIKMASEVNQNQEDALAGLSEDELKSQNQKLRHAISTLSMNFEVEKSRFNSKISELQERAKLVEVYERRLDEMDFLVEEVETKEREKLELEQRVDECSEYEKMVEDMAEEIFKKEEENYEL